jgi:V/A-type H+-transporting ATPase subunit B
VQDVRNLASVIGEEELTSFDKQFIEFGNEFEQKFINQGQTEDRAIEQTLEIGWKCLSILPPEELTRLTEEEIDTYYGR